MPDLAENPSIDYVVLAHDIKRWARELGFDEAGIAGIALDQDEQHLQRWLDHGYHGEMEYMERHGTRRTTPTDGASGPSWKNSAGS